jgi:hypothetical protein
MQSIDDHQLKDEAFKYALICIEHPMPLANLMQQQHHHSNHLVHSYRQLLAHTVISPRQLEVAVVAAASSGAPSTSAATQPPTSTAIATGVGTPASSTPSPSAAGAATISPVASASPSSSTQSLLCCPFVSIASLNACDIQARLLSALQRACRIRSVCLPVCLSTCLPVYLSICLFVHNPRQTIMVDVLCWSHCHYV